MLHILNKKINLLADDRNKHFFKNYFHFKQIKSLVNNGDIFISHWQRVALAFYQNPYFINRYQWFAQT